MPRAFACRPTHWEVRAGYGYQYTNSARPNNFSILNLLPSVVVPLGGPLGPPWWRGRFAWNPELFLALLTHPYVRPILGLTPLQFRYELEPIGGRWAPYLTLGAGILRADVDRKETESLLNFNLQGAVGVRYRFSTRASLILEYRHIHISNAGLDEGNSGMNTHNFLAGLSSEF